MKKEKWINDLEKNLSHIGSIPLNPELSDLIIGWRKENGRKRPIFSFDAIQVSLNTSTNFLGDVHKDGGKILFVNTNPFLNESIKEIANDTGHAFLNGRWIGGLLTNSHNIFARIKGFQEVKEKYGGLRFYMTSANDEMRNLISEAEALSRKTCESCGKPGEARKGRWLRTECDECHKSREQIEDDF